MSWVKGRYGIARWDGEPFPEPHTDALVALGFTLGKPPRQFLTHAAAAAYAVQRAAKTGVRQRVEQIMTRRGPVWVAVPVLEPVGDTA